MSKVINCYEENYPQNLLNIRTYPQRLYYIGNNKLLNHKRIIAIVGSRDCTEYGRRYARSFAKKLAENDICVISGLAVGIDTAAHYGALYERGRTIAVLGGGLNDIYPKDNIWLYNEILENEGCIITEHEDDEETLISGFPQRNRLISGIADAVLVIEAEYRSGSKITARYAKEQGKKVYCIPSNLGSKNGIGTNELIMNGATMVTNPIQIVKDLYDCKVSENECEQQEIIQVSEEYREIYALLKEKERTSDEISRLIGKNIAEVNSILTIMEIEGYIQKDIGNIFKIKEGCS